MLGEFSYDSGQDNDEESDILACSSQHSAQPDSSNDGSDDEDAELWDRILEDYQREDSAELMTCEF